MSEFPDMIEEARRVHHRLVDDFLSRHAADLERAAGWCADSLSRGGKILLFGNGGSAADAQHLAAEFVNRFDRERPGLASVALTTDSSSLTAIANDREFREIFSRQVEALGRSGDIAIGITTSGNSPNVVEGLAAARRLGLRCIALTGGDGGEAGAASDMCLAVPGKETARIQEVHILAGHLVCRMVEDMMQERYYRD